MAKKALITIIGKQDFGDDKDCVEFTTVGTLEENHENYIFRYNEEQENLKKPIRSKLTISKDEKKVEMLRSGAYNSCLIIERSKRNLCRYGTQYGDLLMGIFGRDIECNIDEKEGSFLFSYDIDINGAMSSRNEVKVNYKIQNN